MKDVPSLLERIPKERHVSMTYMGYRIKNGTRSHHYYDNKDNASCAVKTRFYLEGGSNKYPIGTNITIFMCEDSDRYMGLAAKDLITPRVLQSTITSWSLEQKASAVDASKFNDANKDWMNKLEFARTAYRSSSWQEREKILSVIIRHITS